MNDKVKEFLYTDTDIAITDYRYRMNNLESCVFITYTDYPEKEIEENIDKYLKEYILNTINVVRCRDNFMVILSGTKRQVKLK